MEVEVAKDRDIVILRVTGDMRLWGRQGLSDHLRDTLSDAMSGGCRNIILNMREVGRIDSRGIGCLARCHATAISQKAKLAVVLGPGIVHDALTQLNFIKLYPIYPDETAARDYFQGA